MVDQNIPTNLQARYDLFCVKSAVKPQPTNQHGRPRTARFTISEVAVNWQEPMVLSRKCGHQLPMLMDIGPIVASSKHTTAPINHARPSPHKHSPDGATPS